MSTFPTSQSMLYTLMKWLVSLGGILWILHLCSSILSHGALIFPFSFFSSSLSNCQRKRLPSFLFLSLPEAMHFKNWTFKSYLFFEIRLTHLNRIYPFNSYTNSFIWHVSILSYMPDPLFFICFFLALYLAPVLTLKYLPNKPNFFIFHI